MDTALYFAKDLRSALLPTFGMADPPASLWCQLADAAEPVAVWLLTPRAHAMLWAQCSRLEDAWAAGKIAGETVALMWSRWAVIDAWAQANLDPSELASFRAMAQAGRLQVRLHPPEPLPWTPDFVPGEEERHTAFLANVAAHNERALAVWKARQDAIAVKVAKIESQPRPQRMAESVLFDAGMGEGGAEAF